MFFNSYPIDLIQQSVYNIVRRKVLLFFTFYQDGQETHTKTIQITMPAYYERFVCKCGRCRSVCCGGWGITLSRAEYYRLLGLSCPPELRRKLDCAVQIRRNATPEAYAEMAPGFDGKCRLLDEEGYCSLQRTCGEEVLSTVCRLYPRSIKPWNGGMERCCSASCENTVELLMQEPRPLRFVTQERPFSGELPAPCPEAHSALRLRCMALMRDEGLPLPARIAAIGRILGADGQLPADGIPFLRTAHRLISVFSDISPNIAEYGADACRALGIDLPDGTSTSETATSETSTSETFTSETAARFDALEQALYRALPDCGRYYENLLANHLFYEQFPFTDVRTDAAPCDAFPGLCAAYILMRFLTVCHPGEPACDAFSDAAAAAFRFIEHSEFYRNAQIVMRGAGN